MLKKSKKLIFVVSGHQFETRKSTIDRYPKTLLGDEQKNTCYLDGANDRYFFDRNRFAFESILFFYQSHGRLVCPSNVHFGNFIEECKFYQLPLDSIRRLIQQNNSNISVEDESKPRLEPPRTSQTRFWNFLEYPRTSKQAWWLGLWSIIATAASIFLLTFETSVDHSFSTYPHDPLGMIDLVLNTWFAVEMALRVLTCPDKFDYLTNPMNIIDIVIIVPYLTLLIADKSQIQKALPLRLLRAFKLSRVFRLAKHTKNYEMLSSVLSDCFNDLQMFFVCLLIIIVFGGSIIYNLEKSVPNTLFTDIPNSMYFALQTLVTLGYGDITPMTLFGKIFATLFMVFGAITLSLPVLSIVLKFTTTYANMNS